MNIGWKLAAAFVAAVAYWFLDKALMSQYVILLRPLGWWKYPAYIAPGFIVGVGLLGSARFEHLMRKGVENLRGGRFAGVWLWLLRFFGVFGFLVIATVVGGPPLVAVAARFLKLTERQAWLALCIGSLASMWLSVRALDEMTDGRHGVWE